MKIGRLLLYITAVTVLQASSVWATSQQQLGDRNQAIPIKRAQIQSSMVDVSCQQRTLRTQAATCCV
jgi:hypothetical protein